MGLTVPWWIECYAATVHMCSDFKTFSAVLPGWTQSVWVMTLLQRLQGAGGDLASFLTQNRVQLCFTALSLSLSLSHTHTQTQTHTHTKPGMTEWGHHKAFCLGCTATSYHYSFSHSRRRHVIRRQSLMGKKQLPKQIYAALEKGLLNQLQRLDKAQTSSFSYKWEIKYKINDYS